MPQSQLTRVVAVRHGETAWNVDTRIQGQLDIGLNDKGRWQAGRVAQALSGEGLDVVYASDLARAHDTALAIGAAAGLTVLTDRGLRERAFGRFEGQTWADIETHWPAESARWRARDVDFGPEGGETLRAFYARVVDTAERLASRHPGQVIALVAHGGVMDCLYRAAARVGLDAPRTWQLGNTAVNRLLYTPEGFTLVGWSDTSHLDGLQHDEFSDGARDSQPAAEGDKVGHAA
ncbi:histidine phosphatase family protein [Methylibium sp. Pch-M]|uniref:histidine phosphatase family protein n=1 Tax=Methylibium sp. Pch-M TaxID=2082386 RepID=UPI001013AD7F|nr:histidine phosphatase family protein [Methylibium sp. Pch-M]QAZ39872.1 histidine phosphatase family protein [Methylibium sp. Pch-M]